MSRRSRKNRPPDHDNPVPLTAEQNTPKRDARAAAVVCLFLLLAVMLVFGQTLRHGFVNIDDQDYVFWNNDVKRGLTPQGFAGLSRPTTAPTGIRSPGSRTWPIANSTALMPILARGADAEQRAAAAALRPFRLGTPPDQRPVARRQCNSAVPGSLADDRLALAERAGGGPVRSPSVAGGVGRLGGGTKGRPKRVVLPADAGRLCRLRSPPLLVGSISGRRRAVRPGSDGQADAGDAAVRVAVVGLLAARDACPAAVGRHSRLPAEPGGSRRQAMSAPPSSTLVAFDRREAAVAGSFGRLLRGDCLGPTQRDRCQ